MQGAPAFDYLTILLSIVLGLSITCVLAGFARLIDNRARVHFHWLSIFWATWIFIICVQHWWAKFSLRHVSNWTFGGFLLELMVPVMLFLGSAIVLPQSITEPVDLRTWFQSNRRWLFGCLALLPVFSLTTDIVNGGFHFDADHLLVATSIVILGSGFIVANMRWQYILAVIAGAFTVFYVILLFGHLPSG